MNKLVVMFLAVLGSSTGMLQGDKCDWTMVNHDFKNSRSSPCTTITYDDVKEGRIVQQWSHTGDSVQVAPIVSQGVVYYGDLSGNFFAIDITTGSVLNSFVYPNAAHGEFTNGPCAVVDGTVYATTVCAATSPAGAGGLRLYAFDLNLVPKPEFNFGQPVEVDPGYTGVEGSIYAGPMVVDGLVIIATTNSTAEETLQLNPVYRGGLQAFNATNGLFVWRTRISPPVSGYGTSGGAWSTCAIDTDLKMLFVGTTNATSPPASPHTDSLLGMDYKTGVIKWHHQYTKDDVYAFQYACGFDYDVGASPNLFTIHKGKKKHHVVGCGSKEGLYRVFHRKTGKPVWRQHMIGKKSVPSIDGDPSAAFAHDHVYTIANSDTSGISYNAFSVLAQYGLENGNFDALDQLIYYIGNTDFTWIKKMDHKTGKVKWENKRIGASLDSITEANGVLYTGNFHGELRGINTEDGHDTLIDTLPNNIGGPITVVGNQIFVPVGIGGPGGLYVYTLP